MKWKKPSKPWLFPKFQVILKTFGNHIAFKAETTNDLFAGIWLTLYNMKKKQLREMWAAIHTFPGKMIVLGALLGGPMANGAYLAGLSMAGAYAIPITATCSLFGAVFAWIFLKQKPTKKVAAGMVLCVAGALSLTGQNQSQAPILPWESHAPLLRQSAGGLRVWYQVTAALS